MQLTVLRDLSIAWGMIHVIFLFIMLFRSRLPKKKTIVLAATVMGILMVLNMAGILVLGMARMGQLFFLTCSIPSVIFFYLLSRDKGFRFLFTFCIVDTLTVWVMAVTNLLDVYLGGGKYVLMFVVRLLAFPLLEYVAYHFLRKPYLELQDSVKRGWGIFTGLTALYYVLLVYVVNFPTNIADRPKDVLTCVLILILMFFTYATMFSALYRQFLLYQRQQSERILKEQKSSLEAQLDNQQHIRKLKHDMRAHTITVSGLLSSGKTEEAIQYLKQMELGTAALHKEICTNPYINVVFSHYIQKFQEHDMDLKLDIQVGQEELPYMELCQILSNGLENAFDASMELDSGEPMVSVQMKYNRDYLILRIKNRCKDSLSVEKGVLPSTDKKGESHGGFGLLTVQEAVRRLDGELLCYTEGGFFIMDIMVKTSHTKKEKDKKEESKDETKDY